MYIEPMFAVNTVIARSVGDPQADTFLQLFRWDSL